VAHDFNNLLTAIGSGFELIRKNANDSERVQRLAETSIKAVARGERMIKQLLMFARRQVMRPEIVEPNQMLAEFAPLMAHHPAGIQFELEMKLAPDLKRTSVDPTQFERAVLNLVTNAQDAISDGGRIVVETRNVNVAADAAREDLGAGSYVTLSVSDNGRGIAPDILPYVFEPFVTTKDIGKGSGLGLSQVYGFAMESGGNVTVSSPAGQGTTVTLYLPCIAEKPAEQSPLAKDATEGTTVLVVEDDEQVLEMAVENIKDLGYNVLTAENAAKALDILRGGAPIDILFSDIVMPGGMNGAQLAAKAQELRPTMKILLTSGYSSAALAGQGIDRTTPILEKPYRPHDLARRFREMAAQPGLSERSP
jgi:CheY-like chemotaxis protein